MFYCFRGQAGLRTVLPLARPCQRQFFTHTRTPTHRTHAAHTAHTAHAHTHHGTRHMWPMTRLGSDCDCPVLRGACRGEQGLLRQAGGCCGEAPLHHRHLQAQHHPLLLRRRLHLELRLHRFVLSLSFSRACRGDDDVNDGDDEDNPTNGCGGV